MTYGAGFRDPSNQKGRRWERVTRQRYPAPCLSREETLDVEFVASLVRPGGCLHDGCLGVDLCDGIDARFLHGLRPFSSAFPGEVRQSLT